MKSISREEFLELSNANGEYNISIYMPTHRGGMEVNERHDPIVFKNALQSAKRMLADAGASHDSIEKLVKPGLELLKDEMFWNNQTEGLAAFLGNNLFKTVQLPYTVQQQVLVNHVFQTGPLIPMLTANGE